MKEVDYDMIRSSRLHATNLTDMQAYCPIEKQPITMDQFATLVALELELTRDETEELVRRTEVNELLFVSPLNPDLTTTYYYADDVYRSLRDISREEAAMIMVEAAEIIGIREPINNIEMNTILSGYKDAKLVSFWAKPALAIAIREEWINCRDKEMKPKNYMTPDEAMAIVQRFSESALT
jgi:hypothetical protein